MSRFQECLKEVLKHEGGFVNHPQDPGGATNKGITLGTYRATIKPNATVADIKRIPQAHVEKIYRDHYWEPIDGDGLGPGVDLAVFDLAVNSGVGRAKKMFRKVMDLHGIDDAKLINELCDNRLSFLRGLKHWDTFRKGWTRRVSEVRVASLMALDAAHEAPDEPKPAPQPDETPIEEISLPWWLRLLKALFK